MRACFSAALLVCTALVSCGARTELYVCGHPLEQEPPVLRAIAPLSTSIVSSHRVGFRWELLSSATGARVEVCADSRCTRVVTTLDAEGTTGRLASPLEPGVWFWRLRALVNGNVGCAAGPVWEFLVTTRDAPIATSWGSMFDVNRDGLPDVANSVDDISPGTGAVFVFHGLASGGFDPQPATTLRGVEGGGIYYAHHMINAGDLNGDGYADLIVGGESPNGGPGRLEVYLGSSAGIPETPSQLLGGPPIGLPLAGVDDVNGDGYADVAAGTTTDVFLYKGSPAGLDASFTQFQGPGGMFHTADAWPQVASGGDLNGDGYADVLLGLPQANQQGLAFVYLGSRDGIAPQPAAVLGVGETTDTLFSGEVGDLGDLNGDGYADVAVGMMRMANGHLTTAAALFYLGASSGVVQPPVANVTVDTLSPHPVGAGDLNGDGFDEAFLVTTATGAASVARVNGSASGPFPITATGDLTVDVYEMDTAGMVGDVDHDGRADFAAVTENRGVRVWSGVSVPTAGRVIVDLTDPPEPPSHNPALVGSRY